MRKVHGAGINDSKVKVSYVEDGKRRKIKSYEVWQDMLRRCYDFEYQEKYSFYKGCLVQKEWLLYSNFKEWFDVNYPLELSDSIKFHLDKDLISENNKMYSIETCIFIPEKINSFMATKRRDNKTGHIGVSFSRTAKKFQVGIRNFKTHKSEALGYFEDVVEASEVYKTARKRMVILAKQYMRDLNIYSEETINKIK